MMNDKKRKTAPAEAMKRAREEPDIIENKKAKEDDYAETVILALHPATSRGIKTQGVHRRREARKTWRESTMQKEEYRSREKKMDILKKDRSIGY